jgi:non-heme chloroperoxidase
LLIVFGTNNVPADYDAGPSFSELFFDYSDLPELKSFTARDGSQLGYRYYPAESDKVIILLHGAGWHSQYFLPLADYISSEGLAEVYTPDLRGHGPKPIRRGDIDYIGQFEDDLMDLIAIIREDNPDVMLIIGGHSSGGGLAIRFAGSQYGNEADAYLLFSPWLKYNAPTTRQNSGGFANPYTKRIAGLTMWGRMAIMDTKPLMMPPVRHSISVHKLQATGSLA